MRNAGAAPAAIVATAIAMVAFAANSLLARQALALPSIDWAGYTIVRLVSGALALAVLLALGRGWAGLRRLPGDWVAAAALAAYAFAFSRAYLSLGAATGALILFASVQATMIGWGILRGERPTAMRWTGLAVAFAGFVWLVLPGVAMPDPAGAALMTLAGAAWGAYSVRGGGTADPLAATAGNFLRAVPLCLPFLWPVWQGGHATAAGLWLAVASGAVASGLGYAVWYRALPALGAMRAAIVQLTVPVIAAAGAILMLGEAPTLRLGVASVLVIGGVAAAILARPARR